MSDAAQSDPQDTAEAFDEDAIGSLGEFPPDVPLGVEDTDVPESLAERDRRLQPPDELREEVVDAEWAEDAALTDVGQLVDPDDGRPDDEERLLGERAGLVAESAEEQALSVRTSGDAWYPDEP